MLTQLRPPPPEARRGTDRDVACPHCGYCLASRSERGLVVRVPLPVFTATTVRLRCPSCRHATTFDLARLAA